MLHDLRYTVRALLKRPSFTLGSILVLSLAVGVNTAVFSLMNAVLLRPLPVPAADRLAFVYPSDERSFSIGYDAYRELRDEVDVFSGMAARRGDIARLRRGADVVPLQGEAITEGYFELLGVAPRMGRTFTEVDNSPAAQPAAIISEGLWKAQFGADRAILGRTLRIDAAAMFSYSRYAAWRDYTIVGVMPASFTGAGNPWQPAQYWVPIEARASDNRAALGERAGSGTGAVVPVGRLKADVTFGQARAAIDAAGREILQRRFSERLKADATFRLLSARRVRLPGQGAYVMDVPRILATLAAVGTLLLVIAGANLAGMLLARGVTRRGEIAIRLSLGIPRRRLVRQLMIESVLLAMAAGGTGLLVSQLLVAAALRGLPSQLPGSSGIAFSIDVPIDARVVAFAFGSGLATAIVVGLAPAVQAMRVDLLAALAGSTPTGGTSRRRLRRLVLIPQIALALVLLLVTGVFVRTLLRQELAHPGYDATGVVALDVQLPQQSTNLSAHLEEEKTRTRDMQKRVLDRLTALPGVTSAAITDYPFDGVPFAVSTTTIISRADYESTRQYRGVTSGWVSADYFATLAIPLVRGRTFDERDRIERASTVIVSERLANELWPGKDPIGQQLAMHSPDSRYPIRWLEVVGEVASVTRPQDEYPRPVFYHPIDSELLMGTTFLLRGTGNPAALAAAAKQAIADTDPSIIVSRARPLEDAISDVRAPRRFSAAILGASGTAALLLAAIGVFALMSYAVAQRIGEIGVRLVLGAQRRDIVRLIVRDGAALAIAGIALGFALAFAAIRFASHAIVPLPDVDAVTFVTVPAVLAAVVLLACYLPARRAANVDPLVVLRKV